MWDVGWNGYSRGCGIRPKTDSGFPIQSRVEGVGDMGYD